MGWGIPERSEHTGQLQVCSQAKLIVGSGDEEGGGRGNVADGSRSKSVCQTVQMANIGGVSGLILKQLRSTLSVLVCQDVFLQFVPSFQLAAVLLV